MGRSAPLGEPGHAFLESVAMQVRQTGQRDAFDALGGGLDFAGCDARDIAAVIDLDQDVVVETRRQQGLFELICAQIQPRSTSGLHRRYREGHAF